MAIEYQKIVDAEGNPTAAVIPWDEFQAIVEDYMESDQLTSEESEALEEGCRDRELGNEEAYMDLDDFMAQHQ